MVIYVVQRNEESLMKLVKKNERRKKFKSRKGSEKTKNEGTDKEKERLSFHNILVCFCGFLQLKFRVCFLSNSHRFTIMCCV